MRLKRGFQKLVMLTGILSLGIMTCRKARSPISPLPSDSTTILAGYIVDQTSVIPGAEVRIQSCTTHTLTDDRGYFSLNASSSADSVILTAWAPGYYIGGGHHFLPSDTSIIIILKQHHRNDNPDYEWIGAHANFGDPNNCQHCHASSTVDNTTLPFDDWVLDSHGRSAQNHRFLTMYLGTDIYGNQSPPTQYGYNRDYGYFPLRSVYDETYFGPGYRLDFPSTAGNCAACHTPAAAVDDAYGVDPTQVTGVAAEGIGCDFCHKVWDIKLDQAGMPYDNHPGVLSMEFRRPPEGHQFFAGPLDDVAPGEDTYSPIQRESAYCAPCHTAKFWDVQIYNSYGEWLESPYSDPETGQTCQDCHMPSGTADHFARLDKGGLIRDPNTLASHLMPGALDARLLANAVTLTSNGRIEGNEVIVDISIVNDKTGHHVPTDSPLRHLILIVIATDASGNTLDLIAGSELPDWCGIGDPFMGYYSGLPGKAYAKILEEVWTGIYPTGAYWNRTRVRSDNRLAAFASDKSQYRFAKQTKDIVYINVELIFRRAFRQLADWKGWSDPDILMASQQIVLK